MVEYANAADKALGEKYEVEYENIDAAFPQKEEYGYASEEDVGRRGEKNLSWQDRLRRWSSESLEEAIRAAESDSGNKPESG